jgi:tripartite-type tricarboxylate transporter receptor subunit TctC
MIELGFKDFETSIWHGILGPGTLQKDVLAKINSDVNRVLKMADVRDRLTALGMEVVGGSPEAFAAEMKKDHAWASKTIKAIGIKPE